MVSPEWIKKSGRVAGMAARRAAAAEAPCSVCRRTRCGGEGAPGGFAGVAFGILEVHGQRKPRAGREVGGVDLGREVGGFGGGGPPQHPPEGAAAAERGAAVVDSQQG